MTTRAYCNDCEAFVDTYTGKDEVHTEFWGARHVETTYIKCCAQCDSEEVDMVHVCEACGENRPLDGCDDCAECIADEAYAHTVGYEPELIAEARQLLGRA